MTTTTKENAIKNALEFMDTEDLVQVWNTYCGVEQRPDDYIYENNEYVINDLSDTAWDTLNALGEYSTMDAYFAFDGYGYINSFDGICETNSPFEMEELIVWLLSNSQYWDLIGVDDDDLEED